MARQLRDALDAWRAAIGTAHVLDDTATLARCSTATFSTSSTTLAMLRPADRSEVQECVRIACRHRVPLYPVSSGRNWGYGSRAPVQDGVILDLGRLNRIVDFDEELAYVTVEPGVTQQQLYDFLRARQSRLWMDATGASPDCSIIGNTLERGFGHTPMGDHAANACGLEVVLPDGEVLETGFARCGNRAVAASHRMGIGPSLDGLFAQSNMGIVTRMSVWLMPAPQSFAAFFFVARREDRLGPIVDALRRLRLEGTIRSVAHIGNDYKVLAGSQQYPWDEMNNAVPLDAGTMGRIRTRLGIGVWNGSGGLYGTKAQVREAKRRLRRELGPHVDRLQFVNDRTLALLTRFAGPARWLTGWDVQRTLGVLLPVYGLLKGIPTRAPLTSTYWRKRMPIPAAPDPDRDGCGLYWCSPVLPARAGDAAFVTSVTRRVLLEHGFEPQISISLTSERSATCVTTISFDRAVPGEDERAAACYEALTMVLLEHGYPPYRLNVSSMELLRDDGPYDRLLAGLKTAVDPLQVLAPGRYTSVQSPAESRTRIA